MAHIATWLGCVLLGFAAIDFDPPAKAAPQDNPHAAIIDGWAVRAQQERKPRITCTNRVVRTLHSAGFRGNSLRMAYAIVMRESKGQNLDESSRYFTGALGIWQVQTSAWSRQSWWSRSAMLDPAQQSRIVYRYMSKRGTYWAHWGLTPQGTLDSTYYRGWSAWQHEAWIMAPFRKYYNAYPC